MVKIGIVGGSGVYNMEGLTDVEEITVDTPFGPPSDVLIKGKLEGVEVVFIPRHGRGHTLTPTEVPYRANIFALKKLGCEWVLGVSAVGSLKEEIVPGHMVLADQYIDRTKLRDPTFFGKGVVGHVMFGEPVCKTLVGYLEEACKDAGATYHKGGTYVNMEGPQFSTKAESNMYRSFGASVVGMTSLPEAKLCREAEMSYAVLAMATDYDVWHPDHDMVTVDMVMETISKNVATQREVARRVISKIAAHEGPSPYANCLAGGIMTKHSKIPLQRFKDLEPIIGKYVKESDCES